MLRLAFISHFGRCLSCNRTKAIVSAFIISHLEYYDIIWRRTSSAAHKPISVLYNRAARLISQCDYKTHHCELYSKLNWFPPSAKPESYLAQIVYKCRNNMSPTYLNDRLQKASTVLSINAVSAANDTFYILKANSNNGEYSCFFPSTKLQFTRTFCPLLKNSSNLKIN